MNKINILIITLLTGTLSVWAESNRTDYRLDHEFFRRGLIDRGFNDWLKIYDKEFPPSSDLDLLAEQIGRAWLTYRQETDPAKRSVQLETLLKMELERIELYPDYPLAANWRVRYAGDLLNEKLGGYAFIHLIGLELPAELRKGFSEGLGKIETQLDKAKTFLKTKLAEFQAMSNDDLSQINRQGLPELYQSALYQADYLRAWSLYHRACLAPVGSPERVKLLYQLSDLLGLTSSSGSQAQGGSEKLLAAGAWRMLGKPAEARTDLTQARRTLPGTSVLFADIEEARQSLAENQPRRALAMVENCPSEKVYKDDAGRSELVQLSLALIGGRAKIAMLSADDQTKSRNRNKALSTLTQMLAEKVSLRAFVAPVLLELSGNLSLPSLSDVELLAYAQNAQGNEKTPLAIRAYRELISRQETLPALKISAAMELAKILEHQGQFSQALTMLEGIGTIEGDQAAEVMAESARLAWLAYRAKPDAGQRAAFVRTTTALLDRFPKSASADQFKLLIAEELSQTNDFGQSLAWIEQVPAGSDLYLQAKATKVLVLSRQYRQNTQTGTATAPAASARDLADQIETVCKELFVIASARQADPENIKTWTLDETQTKLLAGAVLAAANVLADPEFGRGARAKELMEKYRPILERYQQTSKSAMTMQISTLMQTQTPAGQIEAMNLAMKMIEKNELPPDQQATIVLGVLDSVHRFILKSHADPFTSMGDLAGAEFTLSQSANGLSNNKKLAQDSTDHLREFAVMAAIDAAQYNDAKSLITQLNAAQKKSPDVELAISRMLLAEKKYLDSAGHSMELMEKLSPADVRYWHALIINLHSHLGLGSDASQIASAIVARQQEYPQMGNETTQTELLKILDQVTKK